MGDLDRIGVTGASVDGERLVRFDAPRCENCQCGLGSTQPASTELRWSSYNSSPEPTEGELALLRVSSRGFHEAVAVIFGAPLVGLLAFLLIADTMPGDGTQPGWVAFAMAGGALWLWWRLLRLIRPHLQRRLAVRLDRAHDRS